MDTVEIDTKESPQTKHSLVFTIAWTIIWIFLWPIFVAIISAIILIVISNLITNQPGTMIAIFAMIITTLCLFIMWGIRKSQKHTLVIGSKILAFYTFCGVMLIIFGAGHSIDAASRTDQLNQNQQVATSVVAPPLSRDQQIDAMLVAIGAERSEISRFSTSYVSSYPEAGKWGEYMTYANPTTNNFLYGKMTILQNREKNDLLGATAHEYLHHVWYAVLDDQTKLKLTSDLIAMYGNDATLKDRAKWYSDTQTLQPTELFSMYCTESTDGYLTKYVLSECNKYIDRGAFLMKR